MRILLSGASGFVGKALASYLSERKCEIAPLVHGLNASGEISWRVGGGQSLEDFDAAIHLAGEPLSLGRWSEEKRQKILVSRSIGTLALADALASLRRPPPIFISASAIGYYGNRGEELLDEGSAPGKGFLARVCAAWEEGARPIGDRGARTVQVRFGMVLGPDGGALGKIATLYRLGLGGRLASGEQWVSWVALADLVRALDHILRADSLHGPVNVVSPHPVRQKEFSQALASALGRPAFFHVPKWMLRLQFGTVADEVLLASARAFPKKLQANGFSFRYPDIQDALHSIFY